MEQYKQEFINFMVESEVLKFGEFTLKSGRKSPFFMNAGAYVTGTQLRRLGEYYAKAIHDNYGLDFDVLFGPAYKGIPLAVATSMAIRIDSRFMRRRACPLAEEGSAAWAKSFVPSARRQRMSVCSDRQRQGA